MTILENSLRRKKRRAFSRTPLLNKPSVTAKWIRQPATTTRVPRPFSNPLEVVWKRQRVRLHQEPMDHVEIDEFTARAIQLLVQDLLLDSSGSCSVLTMAHAVATSKTVLDCHADTDVVERVCGGHNYLSEYSSADLRDQFVRSLQQIITRPSSSVERIQSWEDAEDELRKVLAFPAENLNALTAGESEELEDTSFTVDNDLERYKKMLRKVKMLRIDNWFKPSRQKYRNLAKASTQSRIRDSTDFDLADQHLSQELANSYEKRNERLKSDHVREFEERLEQEAKEEEARKHAESLMRPLSQAERDLIKKSMVGPEQEVVAQVGPDSIQRASLQRLQSGQWLNDEVIHYFYVMLSKRDEEMCLADPTRKRSHFFKSFFVTKLLNVGSANEGTYQYSNVKRWSKNVPGKDIFNLDKIIFPVNQGQMHWVCVVIFMQEKKIKFYDSMEGSGDEYVEALFQYVKDEHQSKKGGTLPEEELWELDACTRNVPHQLNGYDCGVFTCMFADFIAKDCALVFSQEHISQCRERIALSILNGKAIM